MPRISMLTGILVCVFSVGCQSARPWDGLVSRFSGSDTEDDALVLEEEVLSEGFQKARGSFSSKGLRNPEATNLAFARWKEDMDQYAEAKRRYHEILTVNQDCLAARLGIARIERETGRFTQCREILEAAQRRHPDNPLVMLELGRMHSERQEWGAAVQAMAQAVEIAPEDQTLRYELGLALTRADRVQEGLPHLRFAVGESAAYYNVGYLQYSRGNINDAVTWIERAMRSHPDERTREMAGELLAEMQVPQLSPSGRALSQSAIVASRAPSGGTPTIMAAPSQRGSAMHISRERTAASVATPMTASASPAYSVSNVAPTQQPAGPLTQPAGPLTQPSPPSPTQQRGYAVTANAGTDHYSYNAGAASPPQWSGPTQPRQSQWSPSTRSTRSQVPVHAAGFSQPLPQPSQPPEWRN